MSEEGGCGDEKADSGVEASSKTILAIWKRL